MSVEKEKWDERNAIERGKEISKEVRSQLMNGYFYVSDIKEYGNDAYEVKAIVYKKGLKA